MLKPMTVQVNFLVLDIMNFLPNISALGLFDISLKLLPTVSIYGSLKTDFSITLARNVSYLSNLRFWSQLIGSVLTFVIIVFQFRLGE